MARRGRRMFEGLGATMIAARKWMQKSAARDRELARLRKAAKARKGGRVRKAARGGRMRGGFHA